MDGQLPVVFGLRPVGRQAVHQAVILELRPGDLVTLGRDRTNRVQLEHGSVATFHARLRCDDWGVWIAALPGAEVVVAGEPHGRTASASERLVAPGATIQIGALLFELVGLAGAAATTPAAAARRAPLGRSLLQWAAGFTGSAALHLLALWGLDLLTFSERAEATFEPIRIGLVDIGRDDGAPLPPDDSAPLALEAPLEQEPVEAAKELEPVADEGPPGGDLDAIDLPAGVRTNIGVGPGGGGGGPGGSGGAGSGLGGMGRLSLDGDGGAGKAGQPLVDRLRTMRGSGLDLVFVIDTTSSMRPFLDGARAAAGTLVSQLAVLVEDLKVGVVAYRDRGDEYVTRVLPLSDDRYAILNFLWALDGEGGGDLPEAIDAGIEAAVAGSSWREKTHQAIVVIGDAPPHADGWPRLKASIGRFRRGQRESIPGAIVSAIYTGPGAEEGGTAGSDGAQALAEIARIGHGDYLDLGGTGEVGRRLLLLTMGPKHARELEQLLTKVKDGPREQVIRRHVAQRDVEWLLERLERPPIHPEVVDGLVQMANSRVLAAVSDLLEDPSRPRASREAALYLLRRCVPAALDFDLDGTPEVQRGVLQRIAASIDRR